MFCGPFPAACVLCSVISATFMAGCRKDSSTISHARINELTIIGQLEKPLGTLVTIRGSWKPMIWFQKRNTIFVADNVDGVPLAKPAYFDVVIPVLDEETFPANPPHEKFDRQQDVEWELRGVEEGRFHGHAWSVWEETFADRPIVSPVEPGFRTSFCYIKPRRLGPQTADAEQQGKSGGN